MKNLFELLTDESLSKLFLAQEKYPATCEFMVMHLKSESNWLNLPYSAILNLMNMGLSEGLSASDVANVFISEN